MLYYFLSYLIFYIPCMAITGVSAYFMKKRMLIRNTVLRIFLSTLASIIPLFGILIYILAKNGNYFMIFDMSPEEFEIPLAIQIATNIAVSAPVAWFISRDGFGRKTTPSIFE